MGVILPAGQNHPGEGRDPLTTKTQQQPGEGRDLPTTKTQQQPGEGRDLPTTKSKQPGEGRDLPTTKPLPGENPEPKSFYVYILTNTHHTTLYIGSTDAPPRRVKEHIRKNKPGFSAKYNCNKLVYLEEQPTIEAARKRERQLKEWQRAWKERLINESNPSWHNLLESVKPSS